MNENINSDVTVADLISMLEDVANKSLPIKCVCLMPEDFEGTSYSGPLDQNHLVVDDDGDEVMLTMDFT